MDPDRNLDAPEGPDEAPDDAALEALEGALAPALGGRGEPVPAARLELRAALRESFVAGRFTGDEPVEPELERVLAHWEIPAASAECRAAAREALLGAEPQRDTIPAAPPRRAPRPARSTSTRLRLVVGGSLLAAAAAVLLLVQSRRGPVPTEPPIDVAVQWTFDGAEGGAAIDAELIEALRVDGRSFGSADELFAALGEAQRIETGLTPIRLRRGQDFVLELGARSSIEVVDGADSEPTSGMEVFAERGSVRVATGPTFSSVGRLVIRTPHVRTEVAGTVYGLDVYPGLTCVCCLEGAVVTEPSSGSAGEATLGASATRLVYATGEDKIVEPIVPTHESRLVALRERVETAGYWL